jgi:signal transduction histidine kinase
MVKWYIVFFSLGAMAITGAFLTAFGLRSYRAALSVSLEMAARYAADGADRFLGGQIDLLEGAMWLGGSRMQAEDPDLDGDILDGILGFSPAILQVATAERKTGLVLRSASRRSATAAQAFGFPFAQEAAKEAEEGRPYLSPVYSDPVTGEFLVTVGVAPYERFGAGSLALVDMVSLKFMRDLMKGKGLEKGGRAYVVDSSGALVAYDDPSRVLAHASLAGIGPVAAFVSAGDGRPQGSLMVFRGIEGDVVAGTYVSLESTSWAVVVELPWRAAYLDAIIANLLGLCVVLAMAAAIYVTGLVLSRRISAPILRLSGAVSGMAESGELLTVEASGYKEVSELAAAFNAMADKLKREEERLQHAMKMEAVGRLAGGVAHDFNNLLTGIYGSIQLAKMEKDDPAKVDFYLDEIRKEAESAASLTRQLLAYSRKQPIKPRLTDMNALVSDLGGMLQRLIGVEVSMEFSLAEGLSPVRVDPGLFQQVLVNLCANARDAMPSGGRLSIRTESAALDGADCSLREGLKPGRYLRLTVEDSGMGMDAEALRHLFEPFYTTKTLGKGTGLGLAMVHGAVHQSGGFIEARSEPGKGCAFSILLPMESGDVAGFIKPVAEGSCPGGSETLLLVEDRPAVMEVTARMLAKLGYAVLRAGGGEEALAALRDGERIDVLVTDISMPGMGGMELAERAVALKPGIKVLFISGYVEEAHKRSAAIEALGPLILKPYTIQELACALRKAVERG